MTRSVLLASALALSLAALGVGFARVAELERHELERRTAPRTLRRLMQAEGSTRVSARLDAMTLRGHEHASFELCADDGLPAARWEGALDFAVLHLEAKKLMLRVPLDAAHLAHVRRNASGGCLVLGSGVLEESGTYTVEAVFPDRPPPEGVLDVALSLRVLAKPRLTTLDLGSVLALGLGLVLLLAAFALRAARASVEQVPFTPPPRGRYALVPASLLSLWAATQLPLYGSTLTLVKGTLLLALQLASAFGLARIFAFGGKTALLGFVKPSRGVMAWGAALLAAPLLASAARLSMHLVPRTAEAPIELFISWPSGMLSAALLGAFLPLGEELFFRGALYGALLPLGRVTAALLSLACFVLLHAEQSWGNWGGLVAVSVTGALLTALRATTGSVLVPALTHVAYNLSLSLASIHAAS